MYDFHFYSQKNLTFANFCVRKKIQQDLGICSLILCKDKAITNIEHDKGSLITLGTRTWLY
jgi:hypothetical protein